MSFVRKITTKIIFLTGLLLPGLYAAQAGQQPTTAALEDRETKSPKRNPSEYGPQLTPIKDSRQSVSLQNKQPNRPKEGFLSGIKTLPNALSKLRSLNNLFLPKEPSEVKITELLPLKIDDLDPLIDSNSSNLKAIGLQVDQAKSLLVAELSKWYPSINLAANGLPGYLSTESYRNPDFGSDSSGTQWNTSVSLQVQWNLIDPARVSSIAAARDVYEKARDTYVITSRDLRLQAINQYFLLQRADEGVRIGKQSMRASLLSLRDAKARFEAGVATRLEVLEAETQLARDKQLLTSKLGDQKISRRALAKILNLPPKITPTAASPAQVIGVWKASLQESIIAAFEFREELDRLLLDISINNSNANTALAAGQPTLSLVNTLSASRFQGQTGVIAPAKIDMNDYGWTVSNTIGLNATWNIFDGGRAKALYKYNKQKAKEAEQNFAVQRDLIRKEVEESFFNLETANQNISTTTREVIAARESLRLARLRFKAGVTTQREVVNNQRDLTQAEVRYSDAITSYNTSLAQLRRRTGIDHIKACKPTNRTSKKFESEELIKVPIEPFPLIPACQASTIKNKG